MDNSLINCINSSLIVPVLAHYLFILHSDSCLSRLYIMVFTSGLREAGTDSSPGIQIQSNGDVQTLILYDRPGDDFVENKGDFFDLAVSLFGFSENCINISDIERVSIVENGNDDWNIETIVTLASDFSGNFEVLTEDFNVNRWIDGDDGVPEHRRFDLNFTGKKYYVLLI